MANVLTNLTRDIFIAADKVSRELVGFIPAATVNGDGSEAAAIGQSVRSHFTRAAAVGDRNVAMVTSEGVDQIIDNAVLQITKDRSVEIPWTGEDIKFVNGGAGFETIYGDQLVQSMRALTNEMESDLRIAAYQAASRAIGTAGTTPFNGGLGDIANLGKIFEDNGAPVNSGERSLVIDSTAGVSLYGLTQLTNVNQSGDTNFLRQGIMGDLNGFSIRKSGTPSAHTAGTGTGYLVNNVAGYAIGATTIAADTGTGTILAGDVVTFNGDPNQYVVATALAGGSFTINAPGLQQPLANNTAITVDASHATNVAFERSALELAVRAPAVPVMGGVRRDSAVDRMTVTDPISGIPFEISVYLGQGKAMMQVAAAWGVKGWKPSNIATLLG